jgi:hypothetical protein
MTTSRQCLRTSALLLIVVPLTFGAPRPKGAEKEPVWFPPEGTVLVYANRDGSEEPCVVTNVEKKGDGQIVEISDFDDGKLVPRMTFVVNSKGLFQADERGKLDPPWQMLKFPVSEGDKWETKVTWPQTGKMSATQTIKAIEKMPWGAGRTERTVVMVATFADRPKNPVTYWLAENTGLVRIAIGDITIYELKEIKPGPKK